MSFVQNSSGATPLASEKNTERKTSSSLTKEASPQQLTSISVMLDYDIDNTLNAIKENGKTKMFTTNDKVGTEKTTPAISTTSAGTNVIPIFISPFDATSTIILNSNSSPQMQPLTVKCDDIKAILPLTPPATPIIQNTARKRWKILAKVLRKDSEETVSSSGEECASEQNASVRRFKSFDLLRQDSFEDHGTLNFLGKPENWYKYKVILDGTPVNQEFTVNIHHMERHLTASDLMGFNNTGNICVWPSEEALTAFVLSDLDSYNGKWILELGGGFACLSGLMLSKYAKPYAVHLTDGNEVSVENVKKTVCLNEIACYTKCSVLKWEDKKARSPSEAGKFDVILSADCLFFDDARSALIDTIWYYLSDSGEALVMAPRRGKTMSLFIEESVQRGFKVAIRQKYNETIWKRHLQLMNSSLYDEDLHYPVLLCLSKSFNQNMTEIFFGPPASVPMDVCK